MAKKLRFLFTLLFVMAATLSWGQTTYKLQKVTSVEANGLYVFEQDGYVMSNTVSSKTLQTTNSYKTAGLIGTETYVWTLESANGGFYMKNVSLSSNAYLNNASSTNISLGSKSSIWAFNFQTDKTVLIQNTSNSNRFLGYSDVEEYSYKAYATSNLSSYSHAINVYKLVEEEVGTIAAPTFSPAAGEVDYGTTVTLTQNDAEMIMYTTDGTDPSYENENGELYSESKPIAITSNTTIKAIAIDGDGNESDVATAAYTVKKPDAPTFNPTSGSVEAGAEITLSANVETIIYTTDGTTPSYANNVGEIYTKPIIINETTTIKAIGVDGGGNESDVAEETYTIIPAGAENAILWSEDFSGYATGESPKGGTFSYTCVNGGSNTRVLDEQLAGGDKPELLVGKSTGSFTAVIPLKNVVGDLTLTYKTNANSLNVSSTTEGIIGSITSNTEGTHSVTFKGITANTTSITIVFKADTKNVRLDDIVLTGLQLPSAVKTPVISLASGAYYEAKSVEIACETEGAAIYYTTDGSEPSATNGTLYNTEQPISISATTTLKAIAIKGEDVSGIASATYTFPVTYNSISALINAAPTGTVILKLTDAQVLYVNNKDMYIKDATGAIDLYNCGLEYTAGKVLNGSLVCTYTLYNNLPEIASVDKDNSNIVAADGTATPVEKDAENVTLADVCQLVQVSGEVISQEGTDSNGKTVINYFINGLQLYDKFKIEGIDLASCVGKNIIATGIVVPFNSNPEIALTKIEVVPTGDVAAPIVFHDSGEYEEELSVPMYAQAGAKIYYTIGESTEAQEYSTPLTIKEDTKITAWSELNGVKSAVVTREYTIVSKPTLPTVADGYYSIKNGTGKYINVAGRKTVTFTDAIDDKAGTVIKVKATNGKVEVLRSQGVDLPGYAKKAMNYVPEIVELVVNKLHAADSGEILGPNGFKKIMDKFNESFDYNLYLEKAGEGYRIYGKTPSMKPVVDFYAENKADVDFKLPQLEDFINKAIKKVREKTNGHGASILTDFSLVEIWERMGSKLTKPVDEASTAKFYEEVLSSEANVWNFAYQTAMKYWEPLIKHDKVKDYLDKLGDYAKYLEKVENIRPDFKYYIVANEAGNDVDFISGGNIDIQNNAARTIWTLEPRADFKVTFDPENVKNGGTEYYATLYTDFGYELAEGMKAYKVTEVDSKGYAKLEEIGTQIPAQTPVLLMTTDLTKTTVKVADGGEKITGENLLVGPDYLINEYQIKTAQVVTLFDMAKEILGESAYNTYVKEEYEHLMLKNSGTVNNKYFFGLPADDLKGITDLRVLGLNDAGMKLGFYGNWTNVKANEAFVINTNNPVKLTKIPDVNRDGVIDVADVTATVDIILGRDKTVPYRFDHDAADVNGDDEISSPDVTMLVDIIKGVLSIE